MTRSVGAGPENGQQPFLFHLFHTREPCRTLAQGSSFFSSVHVSLQAGEFPVAPFIKVCSFTPLSSYS